MNTFNEITFQRISQKNYFLLFILSILFNVDANAQTTYLSHRFESRKPFIYTEAYAGLAVSGFIGCGQNIILGNQWGIHVGYTKGNERSKDQPSNYEGPTSKWGTIPCNHFSEHSFRVSRTLALNKARMRFKGEVGVASVKYDVVHFSPYTVMSGGGFWDWLFGTSSGGTPVTYYHNNYTHEKLLGLSARLVTEFPVSRVLGFHVAVQGTFAKKYSFVGLSTGISLGRVRDKYEQ